MLRLITEALNRDFDDVWDRAAKLHEGRVNPHFVQHRVGMSGAEDFILRFVRSREWSDYPVAARLHISMYDKLNQNVGAMWLGDLFALMAEISFEAAGGVELSIEELDVSHLDALADEAIGASQPRKPILGRVYSPANGDGGEYDIYDEYEYKDE